MAYFSSVYAIVIGVVGIKIDIRVVISLEKLGLRSKVKVYIYILLTNL